MGKLKKPVEAVKRTDTSAPSSKSTLQLPILAAKDLILFPFMVLPVTIADDKSIKLIDDALSKDKKFGYFLIKETTDDVIHAYDLHEYGVMGEVVRMAKLPDGSVRILARGISRVRFRRIIRRQPYLIADVEMALDESDGSQEVQALLKSVSSSFFEMTKYVPYIPEELQSVIMSITEPLRLLYLIAGNLNIPIQEKQRLLETGNLQSRLERVNTLLNKELQLLKLSRKIQGDVKDEIEKVQREHILREQLRAIQKELGVGDERTVDIMELREKIEKANMPKEVRETAEKEVDRLSRIMTGSPEYTVARTYIDWLISLPWSIMTTDHLDIKYAKRILDEDHYDLKKVKDRILEYLAVRKLKSDTKGPILCFLGPPGVGKTSLGMSIARAMGRKFIRISLGGIRDEAEIRGHRRTYVGALPGRIIQSIRKAGSNNPIFMLDEIDKLGMDFRGDPASALLEVLDPEQNNAFVDHYLDLPFNLSKVMFITTANISDPIPPALYDRMEVIELPGYTEEEKIRIAKEFIIPKQLREHGLTAKHIRLGSNAIRQIISTYTREAGLRNLEREVASICRKVAKDIAMGKKGRVSLSKSTVSKFLGPEKFFLDEAEKTTDVGIATGLAWTASGGDILFIEATRMSGSKNLILTGHLGDVMKESAQAALSYLRSRADKYKLQKDFFAKSDIHIHVPAGAIPKDGPSAGITISAALYSLLSGRRLKPSLAMTGEITLRGKVLPVGGVKEKVLAAKRAGIKEVILPTRNAKDLVELPSEVRRTMKFTFVDTLDEMLKRAFTA